MPHANLAHGTHKTALTADQAEQALDYLKRALDRKADLFSTGTKETSCSLATLRQRKLTLARPDFVAEANAWLDGHLTSEGRRTMLAALRQGRAAERREEPVRMVRVTVTTHESLSRLAHELGLSLPDTVAHLVSSSTGRT